VYRLDIVYMQCDCHCFFIKGYLTWLDLTWLSGVVFGDGGSNGAIFDSNEFKMAAPAIFDNSEWPYLRNCSRSTYIARIARSSLR